MAPTGRWAPHSQQSAGLRLPTNPHHSRLNFSFNKAPSWVVAPVVLW